MSRILRTERVLVSDAGLRQWWLSVDRKEYESIIVREVTTPIQVTWPLGGVGLASVEIETTRRLL